MLLKDYRNIEIGTHQINSEAKLLKDIVQVAFPKF
jgi:hypothetical protein